jgi:hypothetical protein
MVQADMLCSPQSILRLHACGGQAAGSCPDACQGTAEWIKNQTWMIWERPQRRFELAEHLVMTVGAHSLSLYDTPRGLLFLLKHRCCGLTASC